jgi:hypothetical protein
MEKIKIDNTNEALEALFAKERNGRILIEVLIKIEIKLSNSFLLH